MSNAPLHRVSWACGALGVVVAVINSLTDSDALASGAYLTSTVLLGVALIIAALVNKPDNRIWPMLLLIAGTSIAGQVIDARFTDQAPEQAINKVYNALLKIHNLFSYNSPVFFGDLVINIFLYVLKLLICSIIFKLL